MASVYEIVTEQVVQALEAGQCPWRKPWNAGHCTPRNITGREYRGINVFLLGLAGYESPYWLTYRQATERGGYIRKGEKGRPVVLWRWYEDEETGEERAAIRYYTVFNIAQCEGITAPEVPPRAFAPIDGAETIIEGLPDGHAPIRHGHEHASYAPLSDEIRMPSREAFATDEEYYSTLFHELTHSTGHESRLGRKGICDRVRFASHEYSEEELIAEMGAAFLAHAAGILPTTLDNSAAYLRSWVKVLKGDSRLVIRAAASAQKAVDSLLGRQTTAGETNTQTASEQPAPMPCAA
jgi:antirestriction protein ArdC